MKRKKLFYAASADSLKDLNPLGEQGWEVINKSPLVFAYFFKMDAKAPILEQFRKWIGKRATAKTSERKELERRGYRFRKVYSDDTDSTFYELDITWDSPLLDWRVEFNVADDPCLVYLTFGDMDFNSVAFCGKETIDRYAPKGVIEKALESGAIKRKYMVIEDDEA